MKRSARYLEDSLPGSPASQNETNSTIAEQSDVVNNEELASTSNIGLF